MKTTRRCYRVDRRQISFVKFILEAYDNVAIMSTLDPRQGVVQVSIAPGCETMVDGIMVSLAEDVEVVPVGLVDESTDGWPMETDNWPVNRRDRFFQ